MRIHRRLPSLALAAALFAAVPGVAQRTLNLDMERPGVATPGFPWGWYAGQSAWSGPRAGSRIDSAVAHGGRASLRVERPAGDTSGSWWASSPVLAAPAAGKRVRLSGWVRTEALRDGSAALRLELMGAGWQTLRVDTMPGRGVSGTTGWTRLVTETVADTGLSALGVGVHVSGTGTVWFDDLVLEVDGRVVTEDLSFTPPTEAQRAWLRARAVPFATPEPGSAPTDMADLAPLGRMVGDARIVSLGEATHGTREFSQGKHRIFSYLVRDHGFSVLMLEANQLAAERINQYVLNGQGSAREALGGVFRVLQTQEVLDLVEWVRAYNQSGAGRVEIVGYDMQDPRLPIDSVRAFLGRADPGFAPAADSAYRGFAEAWNARAYPNLGDSAFAAWERGAERVRRDVDARAAAYLASARTAADTAAVRWAVQNAAVAHDASRLRSDMDTRARRDSAMAVNALWHLAQRPAGTRAAIWAHNTHVSRTPTWMGAYLEAALPGSVLVLAFTSAEGTYRAALASAAAAGERRYGEFALDPAPPASLAHALATAGSDYLLVDMRGAADAPDGRWIRDERPFLAIGGVAVDHGYDPEKAGLYYDVLVFIRRTTAARALP